MTKVSKRLQTLDVSEKIEELVANRAHKIFWRAMSEYFPGEIFDGSQLEERERKGGRIELRYKGKLMVAVIQTGQMKYVFESPIFDNIND